MILGMPPYTFLHVLISLIGIVSGLIVLFGLLTANPLNSWTGIFLSTTLLTDITGFLFPYHGFKPSYPVGAIDTILLLVAIYARYSKHLVGGWNRAYSITAVLALYLNVFVLIAQSFDKVPALHALAPTQSEPPFLVSQGIALVAFIIFTILAAIRFRSVQLRAA